MRLPQLEQYAKAYLNISIKRVSAVPEQWECTITGPLDPKVERPAVFFKRCRLDKITGEGTTSQQAYRNAAHCLRGKIAGVLDNGVYRTIHFPDDLTP